jgi:uncharacterized protein (TIGR04141 family)
VADNLTALQSLTIYRLRNCETPQDALKKTTRTNHHDLDGIGVLVIRKPRPKPPSWAKFFSNRIAEDEFGRSGFPAAVLLITVDSHHFAVTFGAGRFLLDPLKLDQRFGLLVALNSIDAKGVRSIDKQSFDRLATQSRVQASRDASPLDFGLDVEQDLLRAVVGTPKDGATGETIAGFDALHVNWRGKLEQLPRQLRLYAEKHAEKKYKKTFSWVDQILEVRDQAKKDELDQSLIEILKSGNHQQCWMAPDGIIDWPSVSMFQFGSARSAPRFSTLSLEYFLEQIGDVSRLDPEFLSRRIVRALRADDSVAYEWPAMRCMYAEIVLKDRVFMLNAGKWHSIAKTFTEEVQQAIEKIPTYSLTVPEYEHGSETLYNKHVAQLYPNDYALVDRAMIRHGGAHGQIEFCDLYSKNNDIIHLKRFTSSSTMSHLFSQALVSSELFRSDSIFRSKANLVLPEKHRVKNPDAELDVEKYRIVFGIIGGHGSCARLPFFSRVTLKNTYQRLRAFGYQVAAAHIPYTDAYLKTKSFREQKSRIRRKQAQAQKQK